MSGTLALFSAQSEKLREDLRLRRPSDFLIQWKDQLPSQPDAALD
jgi:hypothetical protein